MTRIVDFIFLIFAAFLGKKALLLSVFAFAPSVLANDIPLATLSVENIQVRADWQVVGDDANHFSVEGGTLMLRSNITWAGYPEGSTITAIVEVRDKFSTLNPNYEDLAVRATLTAAIMGCYPHWTINFAIFDGNVAAIGSNSIKDGDVIARRYTENGYNHIALHEDVFIIDSHQAGSRIITSPSLYPYLEEFAPPTANGEPLAVNGSADCFAGDIEMLQEQREKNQYLNANVPLMTGLYSGVQARTVIVSESLVSSDNKQYFYLNDVTLANILNDVFPPKVIIDNGGKLSGKAFSIDPDASGVEDGGSRYEYISNITGGGVTYSSSRAFIFLNHDCPIIGDAVTATKAAGTPLKISAGDVDKAEGKTYVFIQGEPYRFTGLTPASDGDYNINAEGFSDLPAGTYGIKFTDDHFLCEGG